MDDSVFSKLSSEQYDALKKALSLITILVAGADGNIDEQELNWAEQLTHIRSYAKPEELNAFYGDVEANFSSALASTMSELPTDLEQRQQVITDHLSKLNDILPILDNSIGYQIYASFVSFAKHIAKASGGFLRFGSISSEEKQWISLPMIDPIIEEIPEEEDEA